MALYSLSSLRFSARFSARLASRLSSMLLCSSLIASLLRFARAYVLLFFTFCSLTPFAFGQSQGMILTEAATEVQMSPRYLAEIKLNTAQEFQAVLQRADRLFEEGRLQAADNRKDYRKDSAVKKDGGQPQVSPAASPVTFLLHGAEAKVLLKSNYENNRDIVNLAARLSAFEVVEIRVCDTWMTRNNISPAELPPFVGTVRYAPDEKKRLLKEEEYVYF